MFQDRSSWPPGKDLHPAVTAVGPHTEVRERVRGSPARDQRIDLHADPADAAPRAERTRQVCLERPEESAEPLPPGREHPLEEPEEGVGQPEILDGDEILPERRGRPRGDRRSQAGVDPSGGISRPRRTGTPRWPRSDVPPPDSGTAACDRSPDRSAATWSSRACPPRRSPGSHGRSLACQLRPGSGSCCTNETSYVPSGSRAIARASCSGKTRAPKRRSARAR